MRPDRLHPDDLAELTRAAVDVQQTADCVPAIAAGAEYASAAQLALRYGGRSLQWVKAHALDFGATPLSDASNSKLTYHVATADEWMAARRRRRGVGRADSGGGQGGRKAKQPPVKTHTRSGAPLLKII